MSTITNIRTAVNYWWLVLAGLLFLAAGVFVLLMPVESYLELSIFFTVSFIVSGISGIAFSIVNSHYLRGWGLVPGIRLA